MKIIWPLARESLQHQKQEPKVAFKRLARLPLYMKCLLFQLSITVVFFLPYLWVRGHTNVSLKLAVVCYLVQTLVAWLWYADFVFVTPRGKGRRAGDKTKKIQIRTDSDAVRRGKGPD